ncbi:LysE family translocator [Yoonia sp. SDW83-1]|uniref:LysE family translocator n=1 Tax=Yoonia sp. SDW83-1 TaxID=3366945 RepID=UPI00398C74F5
MFETIAALVIFLFPLAYSPGPGNLFFAANGARFGFRATMPANAGYHLATWVVTAGIGFGFLAVMERFPQVFDMLKIAGSLYVLWIAWKMFRSSVLKDEGAARPARFVDGALLLVLNSKAYVIMALMFTQFLEGSQAGQLVAVLVIATVFTLNNLLAFSLWALMGDAIAAGFRSEDSARRLNAVFGIVLAGVAVWMLVA